MPKRQQIWSVLFVTMVSCTLFFLVYMSLVFVNLTYTSIFKYNLLFFLSIVLAGFYVIKPPKIIPSWHDFISNIGLSVLVSIFVVFLAFSYDPWIVPYVRTLPLFEVDNGLGWHRDTAYHVALIRSIMNWGYPSIALDGHPITIYHTLSHYLDAVLCTLSSLDPFDSYGMAFLTKCYFLILTCFLCTAKFTHTRLQFLCVGFVFTPLYIASWYAIGSHALWGESILLLISSCFVVKLLFKKEPIQKREYCVLVLISTLLCLGKITTGFAFISIYFTTLFFKEYKHKAYYVSLSFLITFFFFYQHIFNSSHDLNVTLFDGFHYSIKRFFIPEQKYQGSFYLFSLLFILLSITKKEKHYLYLLFSSVTISLLLFFITYHVRNIDRLYFYLGYYTVFLPIALAAVTDWYQTKMEAENISAVRTVACFALVLIVPFTFLTQYFSLKLPATLYSRFVYKATLPYNTIMKTHHNLMRPINKKEYKSVLRNGKFYHLKKALNDITNRNGLKKSEVALFVPSEIVKKQLLPLNLNPNNTFFYAMNLYSITGVQLVNSLTKLGEKGFGFNDYHEYSMTKELKDFNAIDTCIKNHTKAIIVLKDFDTTSLDFKWCTSA